MCAATLPLLGPGVLLRDVYGHTALGWRLPVLATTTCISPSSPKYYSTTIQRPLQSPRCKPHTNATCKQVSEQIELGVSAMSNRPKVPFGPNPWTAGVDSASFVGFSFTRRPLGHLSERKPVVAVASPWRRRFSLVPCRDWSTEALLGQPAVAGMSRDHHRKNATLLLLPEMESSNASWKRQGVWSLLKRNKTYLQSSKHLC